MNPWGHRQKNARSRGLYRDSQRSRRTHTRAAIPSAALHEAKRMRRAAGAAEGGGAHLGEAGHKGHDNGTKCVHQAQPEQPPACGDHTGPGMCHAGPGMMACGAGYDGMQGLVLRGVRIGTLTCACCSCDWTSTLGGPCWHLHRGIERIPGRSWETDGLEPGLRMATATTLAWKCSTRGNTRGRIYTRG